MMVSSRCFAALAVFSGVSLGACTQSKDESSNQLTGSEAAHPEGVVREEVRTTEPAVQRLAPMAAIQSQPGPEGSQVDLLKVAVTGDILTVTLRCSSEERINNESFKISEISYIEDATSQRVGVLKDSEGNALVSDLNKNSQNRENDYLGAKCESKPGVIWAKFPAPPATSKTVSINFPQIAPFDGVTVTR